MNEQLYSLILVDSEPVYVNKLLYSQYPEWVIARVRADRLYPFSD